MTSSSTQNATSEKKSKFNFSIDHILNEAGSSSNQKDLNVHDAINTTAFPWLQCTRYCPPKIQRIQKREATQRRQLGRHPRIPFTTQQLAILEEKFRESPYLSSAEVLKISRILQLADIRVKIWFQNRRARDRREKLQSETDQRSAMNPYVNGNEETISTQRSFNTSISNTNGSNLNNSEAWTPSVIPTGLSNYAICQTETYLGLFHKSIAKDKRS
ncbi:hypothetical protein RN001_000629 [Aquatica leii]|uniref:Homeobox domain-containing protein n=1 Tax=Aquatica leii TaxID=1421715 RepID=A0AAN7QM49_9COLE|nr:hypothetical protein RN001_000629 [Aquatica leii]